MLERLGFDYRQNPRSYALLLGLLALAAEAVLHAFFGFITAFESLYILPIWLATRIGGRRPGALLVVTSALITTAFDQDASSLSVWLISLLLRLVSYSVVMLMIAQVEGALERHQRMAMTDPLTGLLNRRALTEHGASAIEHAQRSSEPLVIAMIDCDNFKQVNDDHGHEAGDQILRILARSLEVGTRTTDLIARVGGDEFAVVLMKTDEGEARQVMGRIEHAFESAVQRAGFKASLSVGMSQLDKNSDSLASMLAAADESMYARKGSKKRHMLLA